MKRFIRQPSAIDVSALLLPELKKKLKILDNTRDDSLKGLLDVAVILIESYTWRILAECEVIGKFSEFTPSRANNQPMIDCARAPVFDDALISITYRTQEDTDINIEGFLEVVNEFGEVYITEEPQETVACTLYPVTVVFKAGYGEDDEGNWTCPIVLQEAILNMAVYMFENPSDCGAGGCTCSGTSENGVNLPKAVTMLLYPYVLRRYDYAV
ncbi:hypothetical protein [Neisseria sp. Ec49-e6-T10]|uniref:hypothetical protein n=1 Tax=Neisseria sp. Ec49-e6-T10 TaxID=3140744 RepID=UPI003EC0CF17